MGKVTDNCNSMFLMGQRLKECRDIRGLSQDQLAEAVERLSDNRGKTRSAKHISYLENGVRAMSVEYANLLAQALNIRPEYLLLKDDFKTESEIIHALTFGEHEVYDLIIEVMKLHGYEIVAVAGYRYTSYGRLRLVERCRKSYKNSTNPQQE